MKRGSSAVKPSRNGIRGWSSTNTCVSCILPYKSGWKEADTSHHLRLGTWTSTIWHVSKVYFMTDFTYYEKDSVARCAQTKISGDGLVLCRPKHPSQQGTGGLMEGWHKDDIVLAQSLIHSCVA